MLGTFILHTDEHLAHISEAGHLVTAPATCGSHCDNGQ